MSRLTRNVRTGIANPGPLRTKDGKIVFVIEFKENGIESEYVFSPDGTLLGSGEGIKPAELPPAVAEAIKKAHPLAKIKEAKRKLLSDGTVSHFEVEVKEGHKEFELEIDPSGNILKTESD